ncbi:MAG: PD-(D/E)XK nuclease family protein [Phycisphaerae bacterium]
MNDPIRISAKNLGALALPGSCPRCNWLKLHLGHKLPYQIFPGIFSSIDGFTKRVVHTWFDEHGAPPAWLDPLGTIVGYREPPHFSKFNMLNEDHGVLLTGAADGILVRDDGSFVIVDYKTAKFSGAQDELLPMYEVQLNAYAAIGEHCGFAPVTGLALIYMEPMSDGQTCFEGQCCEYGFDMGFSAHVINVQLNADMLSPLLARVRAEHDRPAPPRRHPGCKDCNLTDWLVELFVG